MSQSHDRPFRKLAVIGAGNMGSGIAQKMATEGFPVVLVDIDDEKVAAGLDRIDAMLKEGVERRVFKPEQAESIRGRVEGTSDWSALAEVDLAVEAVFEDLAVKRSVFERLESVCRDDAILGTNTSSFAVTDLAQGAKHPERIVGLHYFYHPAKNRLVEVVPGHETDEGVTARAWSLQEQIGKTPIHSADASGFVVNRYFVPWLNEAVRLLEDRVADIPTIEAACKNAFGVGMGPFELMNVTGVPIALHAARTLGSEFGPMYEPAETLVAQVDSGQDWKLDGQPDAQKLSTVADRMCGVVFLVVGQLVDEGVGSIEDTDIGARVGLRWPNGPFELMNRLGVDRAARLVEQVASRWKVDVPGCIAGRGGEPFRFTLVRRDDRDGVATLTLNRPDAMNALNEEVVRQLRDALDAAAADSSVRGIVIAGAGKGFIAGADIRFFVKHIEADALDRIVSFTEEGHRLLEAIETAGKPVVARMHGLALGGGLELALACDHIVASTKAVMAFPETGIGIYPGLGGTQRTTRRVGRGLARYLVFSGQMLSASEASKIGLVDAVVPPEELDRAVRDAIDRGPVDERTPSAPPEAYAPIASLFESVSPEAILAGEVDSGGDDRLAKTLGRIRTKAPIALRIAGELIDAGAEVDLREGLAMELTRLREIFSTRDALVGLKSVGQRPPAYEGR